MKSIIREVIAMIILIIAILMIVITLFFDYIKENSVEVSAAIYKLSAEEQNILKEKQNYMKSQNSIILSSTYSINNETLSYYKSKGNLVTGQSSPFDETPVTGILYSSDGSSYYDVSNRVRSSDEDTFGSVSGDYYNYIETNQAHKNQENINTNTNKKEEPSEYNNDISAPSVESGSIIPSTGK